MYPADARADGVADTPPLGERFDVIAFKASVLDMTSRADVAFVAQRLKGVEVDL